jgi:hypothetical protein
MVLGNVKGDGMRDGMSKPTATCRPSLAVMSESFRVRFFLVKWHANKVR